MKRNDKAIKYFLLVLASLAAHLAFFYTVIFYSDFLFFSELKRRLDHKIVDKTKDLSTQIELVDQERLQVVEQKENLNDEPAPEDAKFLSASNQKVKKQTKARNNGRFKNATDEQSSKAERNSVALISAKQMLQDQPDTSQKQQITKAEKLGLKGFKPSLNKTLIAKQSSFLANDPSAGSLDLSTSQTDDYLKDVAEGDRTFLNTKKFLFFSFYSRVKEQLVSQWNPLIREEISFVYSTNRSLAHLGKKRTSLKITLNKRGYLEEIALLKTSGNKAVDAAAIQAFRLAAPFPNPPSGLIEKDKKIRILWDFIIET